MTYQVQLPRSFPHSLVLPRDEAADMVTVLMNNDELSNGSSFAVTSDPPKPGDVTLWLSDVSLYVLQKHSMLQP